jgi:TolA-binding protein
MPTFFARHADAFATITTIIFAFVGLVALVEQRFNAQEKLINQRFDAQDRRIDGLEADIAQRFDAQDRRIDDLEADIEQRFDVQARYDIEQRFDAQTDASTKASPLSTNAWIGSPARPPNSASSPPALSSASPATKERSTSSGNKAGLSTCPRPEHAR